MPPRKPTHLKMLEGTFRPGREAREPVAPAAGRARPPAWLPPGERAAFRRLTTEVERTGIPSASFGAVLVGAALAWATLERTTAVLGAAGDTYETSTTNGALKIVPRPEVAQRNTALRLLRAYLAELGLTPAALGRVDRAALPKRPGTARSFLFPKALP